MKDNGERSALDTTMIGDRWAYFWSQGNDDSRTAIKRMSEGIDGIKTPIEVSIFQVQPSKQFAEEFRLSGSDVVVIIVDAQQYNESMRQECKKMVESIAR